MAKFQRTSLVGAKTGRKRARIKRPSVTRGTTKKPIRKTYSTTSETTSTMLGPVIKIDLSSSVKGSQSRITRFGAVTVSSAPPNAETLVLNVNAGREALGRAKAALVKHGIKLQHGADVPRFRVDAGNPKLLIRDVNGRIDRGHIVNGAFVASE